MSKFVSGEFRSFVFLQVDLAGHSKWLTQQASLPFAFSRRKQFAQLLRTRLQDDHRFKSVFWAGDGGLFARLFGHSEDAEAVCAAADTVFEAFQVVFCDDVDLALRVSATYIALVAVDESPGYWLSPELNDFLKHERKIAKHNSFVVTGDLRKLMKENSVSFRRFPEHHRHLAKLDDREVTVFMDTNHPMSVLASQYRFSEWLKAQDHAYVDTTESIAAGWQIGDSIVSASALERTGYGRILLEQVDNEWRLDELPGQHKDKWKKLSEVYMELGGTKASIHRIQHPLTEEPVLKIEWRAVRFPIIKAFHDLNEFDSTFHEAYRSYAAKDNPREIPSNFATHSIVILHSFDDTKHILLAHRKERKKSGYYANCWSVSFEEQYAPIKSFWGGRWHPADDSLNATITRGLREEFLGDHFVGEISVGIHAVLLEARNFNIGILAAATVRASFEEVKKLWPTAVDHQEHDAILAVPFNRESINACLDSDVLPVALRKHPNHGVSAVQENGHKWHPTAKARLVLAKWLLEVGD